MNSDFSDLIVHIDQKFAETNTRIDGLHQDFLTLQTAVDNYAKKADNYY